MSIAQPHLDLEIEAEIARLQNAIRHWAESRDLWFDCGFRDYSSYVDGEPYIPPVATILIAEGGLANVLNGYFDEGYEEQFTQLLMSLGYWWENHNGTTFYIYPEDSEKAHLLNDYFHWQWVCGLVKEDTGDVYEELYGHFATKPEKLHELTWREFEVLLFRIFQNRGFKVELGPGRGDNGVDLRLWQSDPIGDVLTLVQAKRYANRNKIDQTQVAALYGVKTVEGADRALFVTTSSYAPVARRFAERTEGKLDLAESADIVGWCRRAESGVITDKSTLVAPENVRRIIYEVAGGTDSRVLHAAYGHNMTINIFALVIKETQHAALIMRLPNLKIDDDGYGQIGREVPLFDGSTIKCLNGEMVWRAKKRVRSDGTISYWDGQNLFSRWNGRPSTFNYMD